VVVSEEVDKTVKAVCEGISERYDIRFLEIGTEGDHVHFLVQSVPTYSVSKIVTIIKSLIARKVFEKHPEVKKQLWGGGFWTDGFYANTVSRHGNEDAIRNYVKLQGTEEHYKQLHKMSNNEQLELFK
jgi:REP element-mobilizing transposase RayT